MVFVAPEVVEHGDSVPVIIRMAPPMNAGQELFLMRGHQGVAAVKVEGEVAVDEVGLRVRAPGSGVMVAILRRGTDLLAGEKRSLEVVRPGVIPEHNRTALETRRKVKKGEIQLVVRNDSAKHGYVRRVTFDLGVGRVWILGSPLLAKNPFFLIRSGAIDEKPVIDVELAD